MFPRVLVAFQLVSTFGIMQGAWGWEHNAGELFDGLWRVVLADFEVVCSEVGDRVSVLVGDDGELLLPILLGSLETGHLLGQVHRRIPAEALLGESFDEVFRENLRKTGDIEDVLLGIERGELAADLIEIVDQAMGSATHPGVKRRE